MKLRIEKNEAYEQEPELVIYCREVDERVQKIISVLDLQKKKLLGTLEQKEYIVEPEEVLYCESVDSVVFIYTCEQVYRSSYTLNEIENIFLDMGFFRCSKSMVLNINSITSLKSEMGNRIDTILSNGEHIMISRHYAKQFRAILKEAAAYEKNR
jgi:DNA-binding LytR/AlgR family response regulator